MQNDVESLYEFFFSFLNSLSRDGLVFVFCNAVEELSVFSIILLINLELK